MIVVGRPDLFAAEEVDEPSLTVPSGPLELVYETAIAGVSATYAGGEGLVVEISGDGTSGNPITFAVDDTGVTVDSVADVDGTFLTIEADNVTLLNACLATLTATAGRDDEAATIVVTIYRASQFPEGSFVQETISAVTSLPQPSFTSAAGPQTFTESVAVFDAPAIVVDYYDLEAADLELEVLLDGMAYDASLEASAAEINMMYDTGYEPVELEPGEQTFTFNIKRTGESEWADTETVAITVNPTAPVIDPQDGVGSVTVNWTYTGAAEWIRVQVSPAGEEDWSMETVESVISGGTGIGVPGAGLYDVRARTEHVASGTVSSWHTVPDVSISAEEP